MYLAALVSADRPAREDRLDTSGRAHLFPSDTSHDHVRLQGTGRRGGRRSGSAERERRLTDERSAGPRETVHTRASAVRRDVTRLVARLAEDAEIARQRRSRRAQTARRLAPIRQLLAQKRRRPRTVLLENRADPTRTRLSERLERDAGRAHPQELAAVRTLGARRRQPLRRFGRTQRNRTRPFRMEESGRAFAQEAATARNHRSGRRRDHRATPKTASDADARGGRGRHLQRRRFAANAVSRRHVSRSDSGSGPRSASEEAVLRRDGDAAADAAAAAGRQSRSAHAELETGQRIARSHRCRTEQAARERPDLKTSKH